MYPIRAVRGRNQMLTLSEVFQLAGMKKTDLGARRARGLLGFFPLDLAAAVEDEREPAASTRAKYTLADAFALDLFQQAANRRLPNDLVDAMIRNAAGHFDAALALPAKADLFLACALVGESRGPGDDDGRAHAHEIDTLGNLLVWLERYTRGDLERQNDEASQVVLLNLSAARRRVMARVSIMFDRKLAE
jgi:hypothetical protein